MMRWQSFLANITVLAVGAALIIGQSTKEAFSQTSSSSSSSSSSNSNPNQGGILIDAQGVMSRADMSFNESLSDFQRQAVLNAIPADVRKPSALRLVSLNELEKAVAANKGRLTEEMRHLAGLTRIQYVFYYPETKDIVVAGPAEGWVPGRDGFNVGVTTGRPVLELQDLVVALRAYPPKGKSSDVVACSIDPTQEGLARQQAFMQSFGAPNARDLEWPIRYATGLKESQGLNTVSIDGVSPKTHLAQILVAADYQMKLIGLGIERIPVRLVTFYDRTDPLRGVRGLIRWYFVPDYESVRLTGDGFGLELIGESVKLVEEGEMISAGGERTAKSGSSGNAASNVFVRSFTQQYSYIAKTAPVFAQLRNVIDMLVCAAHLQKNGIYKDSGWEMDFFGDESKFAVENYNIPQFVEPMINIKTQGRNAAFPMSGGVTIEAKLALDPKNAKKDENGQITKTRDLVVSQRLPGVWYWDAPLPKNAKSRNSR